MTSRGVSYTLSQGLANAMSSISSAASARELLLEARIFDATLAAKPHKPLPKDKLEAIAAHLGTNHQTPKICGLCLCVDCNGECSGDGAMGG